MKVLTASLILLYPLTRVFGDTDRNLAASDNVNSRYTVESVALPEPEKEKLTGDHLS